MARRLSYSSRFAHSVETVYAAHTERRYWEDKMAEFRKLTPQSEIDEFVVSDEGVSLVLKQTIPRKDLPPIAQTVMKKDMVITRKETLGPLVDATASGDYAASIPAGPGKLTGTQELFPTDTGCTLRKTTEVSVYVPFINGKLEQLMLLHVVDLFRTEAEFTAAWIDG